MTALTERETRVSQVAKVEKILECLLTATAEEGFYGRFTLEVTVQDGAVNTIEGHVDRRYRLDRKVV